MDRTATYSDFAGVCSCFYDLVVNPKEVASFITSKIDCSQPKKALFVGGFFLVAKELSRKGLRISIVDYSDEMVQQGRERLPSLSVEKADLLDLPFDSEFDFVFVVGRVFTHMLSEKDSAMALSSIHKSLKQGGTLFFDNYEDNKIEVTDYFNGRVVAESKEFKIIRNSTTDRVSEQPHVVNWKAEYNVFSDGSVLTYKDEMHHRAFSRGEISDLLAKHGFQVKEQGDNFDDTSFYTLAIAS